MTVAALLDAFAASAPRCSSLQMHGDDVADELVAWAADRAIPCESGLRMHADGRRWTAVNVELPNRAWICAHRETIAADGVAADATISAPGLDVLL